jgi:GINS complex subunit 1
MSYVVHIASIDRNKRCLYAYHMERLNRIESIHWDHNQLPPSVKQNLSSMELDYYDNYKKILHRYMNSIGNIDLSVNIQPPKSLMIEVRAIQDCGIISTSNGSQTINKNDVFYMLRSDAEPLIKRGAIVHILPDTDS